MKNLVLIGLLIAAISLMSIGCPTETKPAANSTDQGGLLLALATFTDGPDGPKPEPATLAILTPSPIQWKYTSVQDPESNVLHKAMVCDLGDGHGEGILTAGGTAAAIKLWSSPTEVTTLWQADFGGKFSRMRDVEVADVSGDGRPNVVVATHDQGVVAVIQPNSDGGFDVEELDREVDTIVHEVEVGDLDADGTIEIYATPSQPNRLDGTDQAGFVVRYVPAQGEGRTVVADLGDRHAKEILVEDLDGDGTDELYVAVEAVSYGYAEILRFDATTAPDAGVRVATLEDKLCRCLTAGDLDGDGRKELVATTHKSGAWLYRPPTSEDGDEWSSELIDANSSGFEHASIVADLDGDGISELYVANDDGGEVNRYTWKDGAAVKETIYVYPEGMTGFTWNIMPMPKGFVFE
ncbi:MAG: VCBS repeat-containing protein [bacterium]|nr:VCBS repeat-containing protein [bacterium]